MTKYGMERRLEEIKGAFGETACAFMTSNPHWARELDEASAGAKRFVQALFAESVLAQLETTDDEWREITSAMCAADWEYMAETSCNHMARAHYRRFAERILETHRPVAVRGGETLNPFFGLTEGGAA